MPTTDPIADLLTRLRNGARARKQYVECPWSKVKECIAGVLVDEGYLQELSVVERGVKKDLRVWLRYDEQQQPVIVGLKRVSRPSLRVYVGAQSIPPVRRGMGINVLSTSEGLMVDREAKRRNVGGELLCSVW